MAETETLHEQRPEAGRQDTARQEPGRQEQQRGGEIDVRRRESGTTLPMQRRDMRPAMFEPFQMMREMDRMFDRVLGAFGVPSMRRAFEPEHFWEGERGFNFAAPAVDFAEDDKAYHLTAELPGLSEQDINLELSGDALTITGEKREEKEEKEKNYHHSERRFGSFRRAIQLPQHVDRDRIEANFKNGVLSVTLPKTQDAMQHQRKIEVKAQ